MHNSSPRGTARAFEVAVLEVSLPVLPRLSSPNPQCPISPNPRPRIPATRNCRPANICPLCVPTHRSFVALAVAAEYVQHTRHRVSVAAAAGDTGGKGGTKGGSVMIGSRTCRADIRRTPDARTDPKQSMQPRCCRSAAPIPARVGAAMAATLLLFALALQCSDLRAEMLFRSAQPKDGQPHWSALKKYANSADTAYPRTLADGTQVPAEEVQVFLNGYITSEDVYGAKVMESLLKTGRQKIAGNIVSFASSGGEVDASLELGRLLHKLGVSTVVARGEQCLSSCVFAFMGGDRRSVAGQIGIHRPYFSSTREVPDRRMIYRQLQKRLQEYIEELDFPLSLYEAVMAVPPESVSMLTPADLKRFYLEGMSPSTQDEADAASARALGISVVQYLQQKAQAQLCAGVHDANGPCEGTAAGGGAADATGRRQKDETASATRAAGSVAGRTDTPGNDTSRDTTGSSRASY